MLSAIRQNLRLYGRDNWMLAAFVAGAFLLGEGILLLSFRLDPFPGAWFPLASIFALAAAVMFPIFFDGVSSFSRWQLATAMGRVRLPRLLARYLLSLLRMALAYLFCFLLWKLDAAIGRAVYGGFFPRPVMEPFYRSPLMFLLFVLTPPLAGLFVGAVLQRFGKRGGIVLYLLFLLSAIGIPQLTRADHGWRLSLCRLLRSLPQPLWLLAAALLLALLLVFTVRTYLRAEVKL